MNDICKSVGHTPRIREELLGLWAFTPKRIVYCERCYKRLWPSSKEFTRWKKIYTKETDELFDFANRSSK